MYEHPDWTSEVGGTLTTAAGRLRDERNDDLVRDMPEQIKPL
jgi:hypothetical protein